MASMMMNNFRMWAAREGLSRLLIVDTAPLWTMVGLATTAMVYTWARSSATATDIRFDRTRRDDILYNDPRVVEETEKYYMTGWLTRLAQLHSHPEVMPPPFKFEIEQPVTAFKMEASMVEPSA